MGFQLPSGLAIYQSPCINSGGGRGVVGSPHNIFTHNNTHQQFDVCLTNAYGSIGRHQSDVPLLGYQDSKPSSGLSTTAFLSTPMRVLEEVEVTGSEITYRCPQCRNCKTCKHGPKNNIIMHQRGDRAEH